MEIEQALAKIAELERNLEKFKGIDPDKVAKDQATLSDQLNATQRQLNELKTTAEQEKTRLQSEITRRDLRTEFDKAFIGTKGLPEYSEVLFQTAIAGDNLTLRDGAVLDKSGKPLTEVLTNFKARYPAMFAPESDAAGSGATGSNTASSAGSVRTVTPDNGLITGVDPAAVLKGEVKIAG